MLADSKLSPERQRHAVDVVERNAKSMAQLIEDLLDVSRIVSGKVRLNVALTQLTPIVEAALESIHPAADAKEIAIVRALDSQRAEVLGDASRLQQIVWNLVSNAVKFTPERGRIDVVLTRREAGIELRVTDNGPGIDPRFLPHVFEPFRQADGGIARVHGGLGLGLSITRHLVELHGGEIEARNEPSEGPRSWCAFGSRRHLRPSSRPSDHAPNMRKGRRIWPSYRCWWSMTRMMPACSSKKCSSKPG